MKKVRFIMAVRSKTNRNKWNVSIDAIQTWSLDKFNEAVDNRKTPFHDKINLRVVKKGNVTTVYHDYQDDRIKCTIEVLEDVKPSNELIVKRVRNKEPRKTPYNDELQAMQAMKRKIKARIVKIRKRGALLASSVNVEKSYLDNHHRMELSEVKKGVAMLNRIERLENQFKKASR